MKIEVAYATPAKQLIRVLEVSEDTQAEEAVRLSKISDEFPEIDLDNLKLGIFGKAISGQQRLKAGSTSWFAKRLKTGAVITPKIPPTN